MTEINNRKPSLTDEELGLKKKDDFRKTDITKENSKGVKRVSEALQNAAATAALKAAIDANNELSASEAEKTYIKEKMKYFFQKHLAEIKKGCIFALANDKKRVLRKMVR